MAILELLGSEFKPKSKEEKGKKKEAASPKAKPAGKSERKPRAEKAKGGGEPTAG